MATVNCCTGCPHGCRYCYARYDSVVRHGRVSAEQWCNSAVDEEAVSRKQPLYPGTVMFPATHDIHPEILTDCLTILKNLVAAGNNVLVVSKPHFGCITSICDSFLENKQQLLFRFTITAQDNAILSFWEPSAPSYEERLDCLRYAFENGFATSVSIEPMLESENVVALVEELLPYVTHSIWLGKMNNIAQRVSCDTAEMLKEVRRIRENQSDRKIKVIYAKLKDNPLIRWKESIKEVVGLEPAPRAGLDI